MNESSVLNIAIYGPPYERFKHDLKAQLLLLLLSVTIFVQFQVEPWWHDYFPWSWPRYDPRKQNQLQLLQRIEKL